MSEKVKIPKKFAEFLKKDIELEKTAFDKIVKAQEERKKRFQDKIEASAKEALEKYNDRIKNLEAAKTEAVKRYDKEIKNYKDLIKTMENQDTKMKVDLSKKGRVKNIIK